MTLKEFREWLARVERAYPVYDWKVDGLQVWPMIRLMTHGANFHGRSEGSFVGAGGRAYLRVLVHAVTSWTRATVVDRRNNVRPDGPADAVFLAYSGGRQPLIDGRRFNPLLAPYVELLERQGLRARVWEMSPHGDYNVPRYTPSAFVQPWIIVLRIASLLRPGVRFAESLPRFDDLAADAAAAGLDFPYRRRQQLHRDVYAIRLLARRFSRWLRRARPKVVFTADAGLREQALCVACRELGIPTVEIQHGVQDRNPTYAEFHALPPIGMASRARAFWCWDPTSAGAVGAWASAAPAAHKVVMGGDPWLEMWLSDPHPLAARVVESVAARRRAVGGARHILVTLSSIGDVVPPVVADAVRGAPAEWRWWFRMHPVNQARRLAETQAMVESLGGDVELMAFATEVPLFALLRVMDAHVTAGFSTVVQQAAALGVPSVGCSTVVADLFPAEVASDMVRVAESGEAVVAALRDFLSRTRRQSLNGRPDAQAAMAAILGMAPAPAAGCR